MQMHSRLLILLLCVCGLRLNSDRTLLQCLPVCWVILVVFPHPGLRISPIICHIRRQLIKEYGVLWWKNQKHPYQYPTFSLAPPSHLSNHGNRKSALGTKPRTGRKTPQGGNVQHGELTGQVGMSLSQTQHIQFLVAHLPFLNVNEILPEKTEQLQLQRATK